MNRSVFIAAAICAVLLAGMAALSFTSDPAEEEALARGERWSATDPGAEPGADVRDGNRTTRGNAGANTTARKRAGRASSDTREPDERRARNRTAISGVDPSADTARIDGHRRGGHDPNRRERGGGAVLGGRAADIVGDDTSFRAAVERLSADDPSRPAVDVDDEEMADELAREPPATPVVDDSMTYNSGDYRFSLDSPFQIPNTGDTGTVALWLQPEWSPENNEDAALIELGDGLFRVYKNVNVLRFEVMSDSPEHSAGFSIAAWQPGEWHSLSATWEGQQVTFYVDGQPVGAPIRGSFEVDGETPVTIGSLPPPDQPVAPGTVSDVSLRARALAASEVTRLHNRSALAKRP